MHLMIIIHHTLSSWEDHSFFSLYPQQAHKTLKKGVINMREDKLDIFILCVKKNTFKVNRKALMKIKANNNINILHEIVF